MYISVFMPCCPGGSESKVCLQCMRPGFNFWVGKIPWRRKWQPTPVFLPGELHGQKSLPGHRGLQRVRHDWVTNTFTFTVHIFTSLVKFIHKCFILCDGIMYETVFCFILNCLFKVYRNTTEFLYINIMFCNFAQLISSNRYSWVIWDFILFFSIYKIMSSVNRDSFASYFSRWMPFICFPCLMLWQSFHKILKKMIRADTFGLFLMSV